MKKIYYIAWDYDYYESGRYVKSNSGVEGFWDHSPSEAEIVIYLLKKYPGWSQQIKDTGSFSRTNVVWDILDWEKIGEL